MFFLASADWMQRNFDWRVEIRFPVLDGQHQVKLKEILEIQLSDNIKGWRFEPDGSLKRATQPNGPSTRSQERLFELMRNNNGGNSARDSATYLKSIKGAESASQDSLEQALFCLIRSQRRLWLRDAQD
jgi:hypothetical protein